MGERGHADKTIHFKLLIFRASLTIDATKLEVTFVYSTFIQVLGLHRLFPCMCVKGKEETLHCYRQNEQ